MANYKARTTYQDKRVAESYDEVRFTSVHGKYLDELEKQATRHLMRRVDKPSLVLDLASGTGRFAKLALDEGNRVVAADISLELLKISSQRLGNHQDLKGFVLCDAEKLPFKGGAFDCVIAIRFMGMLPPPVRQNILLETRRVSRKWAILNFPNSLSAITFLKLIWKLKRQSPEYYSTSPWALKKELSACGFEITKRCQPLLVPPRRLPKLFLGMIKAINRLGSWSPLGYFSEQYFVLLEKRDSCEF